MKNFLGDGDVFEFTGQAKATGDVVVQGALIGVSATTVTSSQTGTGKRSGRFTVPKLATDDMNTVGAKLYWNASNGNFQLTQIAGKWGATVAKVSGVNATTVEAYLHGLTLTD